MKAISLPPSGGQKAVCQDVGENRLSWGVVSGDAQGGQSPYSTKKAQLAGHQQGLPLRQPAWHAHWHLGRPEGMREREREGWEE